MIFPRRIDSQDTSYRPVMVTWSSELRRSISKAKVMLRMVCLMYVAHQSCWIDLSSRNLTSDWLRRVEEYFAGVDDGPKLSILQSFKELDNPSTFVDAFFTKYSEATRQLLAAEDCAYLLTISQRPGQKPAPFIPFLLPISRFSLKRSASRNTDNFPRLMVAPHRILCGCGGYRSCV